jgi:hypothetical protein
MAKCSPEYNDETRRLKAHVADLRRVAKGAESGDFGEAIRAKANETIDSGVTDPTKVVEAAHEFINKYAPHEKADVAAKIAEKPKAATQSEASKQRAAVRAEIRDLEKVQKGLDADAAERAKQSEKQSNAALDRHIADLERQIETNVNTEQQRGKPDTPEIAAKRAKLADLREQKKMQTNPPPAVFPEKAKGRPKDVQAEREKQERNRLTNDIKKLDEQIAKGQAEAKKGDVQRADTAEVAKLKAERAAKQQEVDNLRPSPEATRPVDPNVAKNKAALNRLKAKEAELTRQLETNDFPEPQKRSTRGQSEDVKQAQQKVEAIKRQTDAAIEKGNRLNQGWFKTALELAHIEYLFSIFTSPKVIPKLLYAVAGGHIHSFLSDATISLARTVPRLRKILDQAPQYGVGLTTRGLKARYGEGVKAIPKAMKETIQQGATHEEIAEGNPAHQSDSFLFHIGTMTDALNTAGKANRALEVARVVSSYPARFHGVEKTMLSVPAMFESRVKQTIQIERSMKSAGKTDAEIHEFLNRPSTAASINGRAVAKGYEEKMQGANKFNDMLLAGIRAADKSKNIGANIIGAIFKRLLPVTRVGPNVFKQGVEMVPLVGTLKAAFKGMEGGEMTPERADYIARNIGAQGSGALLMMALGMVFHKYFGGVPGAAIKKDPNAEIQEGQAKFGGLDVGGEAFHGSPFAMPEIGAGIVKVYEEDRKLFPQDTAVDAALYSIFSNLKNWGERTLPYTDLMRRTENTLEYGRNHGKDQSPWMEVLGGQLRGSIPQVIQQEAAREDPNKNYLRPRNITEDMMAGIPGQRQKVPHSNKGPPGAKP